MVEISNNGIITMVRGDYFEIPLFINQGNHLYPIRYSLLKDPNSTVTFAIMMPGQSFESAFIRKTYNVDSFHTSQHDLKIVLKPEDTLNVPPGKYFYSVRLNLFQHGHYCPRIIIPERMFFIKE